MLLPVVIILLRKKMRRRYYKWASKPINENQLNHFIMNEEFLHYLWKYRLLEPELRTVLGDRLIIIHPGEHNRDGGPDFFNARLKINNTTWAGNVEIHVQASGWYKHKHHEDSAYDNIILHAVYDNDVDVKRLSEEKIPALVMKGHFPDYIYERYRYFQENSQWVPCPPRSRRSPSRLTATMRFSASICAGSRSLRVPSSSNSRSKGLYHSRWKMTGEKGCVTWTLR